MAKHTCFDEMNARLKPYNAKIAYGLSINKDHSRMEAAYFVQTEKLDSNVRSKKPPLVMMEHCPFCGIRLADAEK